MNRIVARKFGPNVCRLRIPWRPFSTDVAAKSSTSNAGNPEQETEGEQYDVAIVGGGMVGLALACSLASRPLTKHLNIAIIDSNPALGRKHLIKKDDLPDPRVSTVTPATISFFRDIGAWQYVDKQRHAYFDKMQVWDYTGLGFTKYNARDANKEVLGCVVENKVLLSSLLSRVQDIDVQNKIYPSRLNSMSILPNSSSLEVDSTSSATSLFTHGRLAKLELEDGNSLYAKLVVGADGGKSRVRELAGFRTTGWNYSQNAIICTVEHAIENHCAWQRFLPAGPIALLPIGDKFSNIVWTMNPKESSEFKSMSEDDFLKAVNHALDYGYGPHPKSSVMGNAGIFSWLKGNITVSAKDCFEVPPKVVKLASERMAFPLSLRHANDYTSKRVVLIGDAAHTVHPLAGQGVNLGFGDASTLSNVISEGIAVGTDIGEVSLLKKYEADRKPANVMMMAVLDGFQKAYSVDFGPLNILRAAAFHGAQYISPLKTSIISYASGEQRLPLFS
ncbi:Ubiquinone biosynthesis monooxygenase, COQ6-type [Corchorus olitorius]|uniref:Ubiquinone biosynthesis monooxygenase COQ6, mitochondrial n=1 Tax=Corchorus olitorius TaxID=93759 RepID=A0A1R3J0K0_9ROSI|nr:Ubiquinone biosynthesis monooxygenase, COQ6-type [Corchorus olitorius]